jgi:hypothetical protein
MSFYESPERYSRRRHDAQRSEGPSGLRIHDNLHLWHAAPANELAIRMEMERRISIYLNRPKPSPRRAGMTHSPWVASKGH